ncbi:hypothetical protein F511_15251 [Dorcoceras hygrometricum]|uniref:Uncharacterized protein n=1 Tax=Dorcoceras hygrometricum TaxID=472368 RepID=A0A2Z7D7F1_9LAMI|nr:hypothetical protein F511_15251 [Dorcoceras hygrometricum]
MELERRSSARSYSWKSADTFLEEIQQMRRGARFGLSCDDISLCVITISRWSEAQKLMRRRVEIQQMRSVAPKWKEDKIAFWSAEEFWKLSNGKISQQRLYIRSDAL